MFPLLSHVTVDTMARLGETIKLQLALKLARVSRRGSCEAHTATIATLLPGRSVLDLRQRLDRLPLNPEKIRDRKYGPEKGIAFVLFSGMYRDVFITTRGDFKIVQTVKTLI